LDVSLFKTLSLCTTTATITATTAITTRCISPRKQLRLELDWVKLGGGVTSSSDGDSEGDGSEAVGGKQRGATPVVYNFGHGGAGLTLAWGTAGEAVGLVKQALGA